MTFNLLWLIYATPLSVLLWGHIHLRQRREVRAQAILTGAKEAGLTEPPSLHPVVDPVICMGSGACAMACPEQAIGIVKGKAVLVNPSHCIGHGACAAACSRIGKLTSKPWRPAREGNSANKAPVPQPSSSRLRVERTPAFSNKYDRSWAVQPAC